MFYAYIFLGAGILILSILFRLAAVFRLTIPLLYALVVPTLLSDWYYAHYTLANVIWYILLAVTVLSWVYSLCGNSPPSWSGAGAGKKKRKF